MRALFVVVVVAAGLLSAGPAEAGKISSGEIVVGQGANGATLGMTRAEVVGALGQPLDENPQGVLSYQPFTASAAGIFDIYRGGEGKTVDLFVISFPGSAKWTLDDGNKIFKRGAIKRLYAEYGDRVRKRNVKDDGSLYYVIRGRFAGRPVETAFLVDKFSEADAHVLDVFISIRT
jgi:hypothetical protein